MTTSTPQGSYRKKTRQQPKLPSTDDSFHVSPIIPDQLVSQYFETMKSNKRTIGGKHVSTHASSPPSSPESSSALTCAKRDVDYVHPDKSYSRFKNGVVTSYGIALVRRLRNRIPEVLFIKKRVTYSYITFVKGAYNRSNEVEMVKLFSGMTVEEKINIMSLNFANIWYMSYLTQPHRMTTREVNRYETCKARFEKRFMYDNGKRLLKLLRSTSNSKCIWEIPKGMPTKNEFPIQTAIREFGEETGIKKNKYSIIWGANPLEYNFTDENVSYRYVYYIAEMLDHRYSPSVDVASRAPSILESSDIRFMPLEEIQYRFGLTHPIYILSKKALDIVKHSCDTQCR